MRYFQIMNILEPKTFRCPMALYISCDSSGFSGIVTLKPPGGVFAV